MAMDGLAWISELLKTITDKKLLKKEIIKLKDIVNNGLHLKQKLLRILRLRLINF